MDICTLVVQPLYGIDYPLEDHYWIIRWIKTMHIYLYILWICTQKMPIQNGLIDRSPTTYGRFPEYELRDVALVSVRKWYGHSPLLNCQNVEIFNGFSSFWWSEKQQSRQKQSITLKEQKPHNGMSLQAQSRGNETWGINIENIVGVDIFNGFSWF